MAVRRTQDERKAETRARLLAAAADLFASHGVGAVSVDAIAEAADRTSGAVYAHFGSKQGLLVALLEQWRHSLVSVVADAFEEAAGLEERLRAVAANVVVHPSEDTRRMLALERELWRLAERDPSIATVLRQRSVDAQARMARGFASWMDDGLVPRADPDTVAGTFRALVVGLELQQRLDPVLDVEQATAMLSRVVGEDPDAARRGAPSKPAPRPNEKTRSA
jgi:AcrR family transcriptional regulator